jgi:hypothetical protein
MKGVVPEVLDPGTYYLNPYLVNVVEVNLQSQRFEMSGGDAITFFTLDGFTVRVEGTIEFNISRDKAALITHRVGDMEDVLKKIILPRARGFSRIEGSKHPAINFIIGETRQQFQDNLETHLRQQAQEWGVNVRSVLIRNILPPDQIASVIREREVAVQDARKFEQQIEQARSQAELVRQEMLAQQNKEKVQADTARIRAVIGAQQELAVQVTAAQRELEVSRLEKDAATFQAQAILAKAQGDRDVVRLDNQARAAVLGTQVQAFGAVWTWPATPCTASLGPASSPSSRAMTTRAWVPCSGPSCRAPEARHEARIRVPGAGPGGGAIGRLVGLVPLLRAAGPHGGAHGQDRVAAAPGADPGGARAAGHPGAGAGRGPTLS